MVHWGASNSTVYVSESIIDWSSTIMAIFNGTIFQWNFAWIRIQWSHHFIDGTCVGCKPFQEKKIEIEILASSDSVFSPDSEYGFENS